MLVCQNLHAMTGEDSARVVTLQVLNAQNRYSPLTSQLPNNWAGTSTKKRIDIALKGVSSSAEGWYGAVEVKWPGRSFAVKTTREEIVEDVVRLAFVETSNLRANLLVVGGTADAIEKLFDKAHKKQELEDMRLAFGRLLPRAKVGTTGHLDHKELTSHFSSFSSRVPSSVFGQFDGRLKAELLAVCQVSLGDQARGHVYAWHCKRTRGTA